MQGYNHLKFIASLNTRHIVKWK